MTQGSRPPGFENFRPGSENPQAAQTPRTRPPGARPPGPPPRRRPGPGKKPRRKSSSGLGSVLMFIGIGLVALVGAGLAFLAIAPPTDFIRDQLVAQVREQTGRELRITGKTGLTFYPSLGFTMNNVALSAPPSMGGPPFARMKSMTVQVRLLPLLSRQVSVERFVLEKPVFDFRVDKDGRKTWDFASAAAFNGKVRLAQAGGSGTLNDAGSTGGSGMVNVAALEGLELGDVRIVDGLVRYLDETTSTKHTIDAIDVTLALKSISKAFTADGNITYRRQKIDFNAVLDDLKKILTKAPADIDAKFKSEHLDGQYSGKIDVSGDLRLDGNLTAESDSVRDLAQWLGSRLPPATGFGPFSLQGRLKADGPTYELVDTNLGLDGATGKGSVKIETAPARPKISGNFRLSELDLNKYLPPDGETSAPARRRAPSPANGAGAGSKTKPDSIEDLMDRQPATRVRGYTKRAGWSTDPIDLTPLSAFDADLVLELGQLFYQKIKVGKSLLNVDLINSLLTAKLDEMQLYEGTGKGIVKINARRPIPALGANFNLSNVSAQPLLADAADFDRLAGKGRVLLAIKSAGESQASLIGSLHGTANIAFENGAVVGVNVAKWIRALQQGRFNDLQGGAEEQTDFSELTASFNIRRGIATNKDLSMLSPLLRVTGEGDIALPARTVDYMVKPKLVANLSGQGGARDAGGLEIPVRIHGPFDNLKYTPNIDADAAADTIRNLGRQYGGEKAGKVLDDLLGGGSDGSSDGGSKAKKLLDGFLGGR